MSLVILYMLVVFKRGSVSAQVGAASGRGVGGMGQVSSTSRMVVKRNGHGRITVVVNKKWVSSTLTCTYCPNV
jgi:anti-sigma regulatory factor (Ser/Thr protein kinase)